MDGHPKTDPQVKWLLGVFAAFIAGGMVWYVSWTVMSISAIGNEQSNSATRVIEIEKRLDRMPREGSDAVAAQRFDDLNRRLGGIENDIRMISAKLDHVTTTKN